MSAPTSRTISWLSLVLEADPDHYEDPVAYRFSKGRTFLSTDRRRGGIYTPPARWQDEEVTWQGEHGTW